MVGRLRSELRDEQQEMLRTKDQCNGVELRCIENEKRLSRHASEMEHAELFYAEDTEKNEQVFIRLHQEHAAEMARELPKVMQLQKEKDEVATALEKAERLSAKHLGDAKMTTVRLESAKESLKLSERAQPKIAECNRHQQRTDRVCRSRRTETSSGGYGRERSVRW